MGLKSGSRDAGLDDAEDEGEQEETNQIDESEKTGTDSESGQHSSTADTETAETAKSAETTETAGTESAAQRPTMESIPYKLRRNKVNEGREQVPYFLREEVIRDEADLQETLEEILGEKVYKSDYREAAMVVAQRNPELVAAVLREWGYDLNQK